MSRYEEIRPGMVFDGDIIMVHTYEYDESIISSVRNSHFVNRRRYWRIDWINNNGTAYTTDSTGKKHLINIFTDTRFIKAYRRTA